MTIIYCTANKKAWSILKGKAEVDMVDRESIQKVIALKPERYLSKALPPETVKREIDRFFEKGGWHFTVPAHFLYFQIRMWLWQAWYWPQVLCLIADRCWYWLKVLKYAVLHWNAFSANPTAYNCDIPQKFSSGVVQSVRIGYNYESNMR